MVLRGVRAARPVAASCMHNFMHWRAFSSHICAVTSLRHGLVALPSFVYSKTFQRFAVRSSKMVEDMNSKGAHLASASTYAICLQQ